MSNAFWVELALALLGFVGFIMLVLKFKTGLVQRAKARQLRRMLVPEFQAILPALAAQLHSQEIGADSYAHNNVAIAQFARSLDHVLKDSDGFYSEEYAAMSEFVFALESVLPNFQSDTLSTRMVEELILIGQRAIHEMTENGF